jgi:hypothetical protein
MSASTQSLPDPGEPQIQNWVTVESPHGLRNFTLVMGDISTARDAAIAVPTHANTDIPMSGAVMDAMRGRAGVEFNSHHPIVSPEPGFGTYQVADCGTLPNGSVLLVRIPGVVAAQQRGKDPLETYRDALWTLFGSLAALEVRGQGFASLAMPLFAGTRDYPVREIMRIILDTSLEWLRTSRSMRSINLYLMDPETVGLWTEAMDEVLGRRFIDSAQNALVHALRDEIVVRLGNSGGRFDSAQWKACTERLSAALAHSKIPLERVAAEARALVECIVVSALRQDGVQQPKGQLDDRIKELRRRGKIAPWILAHFNCLKVFGNAAVHGGDVVTYNPPRLREDDLIPILAALQRVLAFAQANETSPESPSEP